MFRHSDSLTDSSPRSFHGSDQTSLPSMLTVPGTAVRKTAVAEIGRARRVKIRPVRPSVSIERGVRPSVISISSSRWRGLMMPHHRFLPNLFILYSLMSENSIRRQQSRGGIAGEAGKKSIRPRQRVFCGPARRCQRRIRVPRLKASSHCCSGPIPIREGLPSVTKVAPTARELNLREMAFPL